MRLTGILFSTLAVAASTASSQLTVTKNAPLSSAPCQSCLTMAEAKINVVLNVVLNAVVIEGCGDLCSHVAENMTTHCEVVCAAKGLKLFVELLNVTGPYIDPFAYCELVMDVCPVGLPDAAVDMVGATCSPLEGPAGTNVNHEGTVFDTQLDFTVENATGLGEIRVDLYEVSNGVYVTGASYVNEGFEPGDYTASFSVDTKYIPPTPVDENPPYWYPGNYSVVYKFCQSMCGSAYPESFPMDFGNASVMFNVTKY